MRTSYLHADQLATVPSSINLQADISNILPGYQDTLAAPSWVAPPPGGARPGQVAALLGETPAVSSQFHNTTADLTLTHMSAPNQVMLAMLEQTQACSGRLHAPAPGRLHAPPTQPHLPSQRHRRR